MPVGDIATRDDDQRILLIGVGNPMRSDDSVGRVVAQRIRELHRPGLRSVEHDGEGTSLIELWRKCAAVIVVDGVSSGSAAGTIHRFDAIRERIPRVSFGSTTHAFGLLEAVELARSLGQLLPDSLIIYGIEGKSFSYGKELSPEVQRAVPQVVKEILEEMTAHWQPEEAQRGEVKWKKE